MSRMRQRWGLRAKMSASYVLVTAAAVLVVEIVALVLVRPLVTAPAQDPSQPVQATAQDYATQVVARNAQLGRLPKGADEIQLGESTLRLEPGQARLHESGKAVRIPFTEKESFDDSRPMSLAVLLDPDLRIVASSYPARYPVDARVGGPGVDVLPENALLKFTQVAEPGNGRFMLPNGPVLWAIAPVRDIGKDAIVKGTGKENAMPVPPPPLGFVYVQVPETPEILAMAPQAKRESPLDQLGPVFGVGALVLLGATPVGVVFGLLATRSLTRRLRRLAASTVAVADGQYQHRIPVSGRDEIAQLEGNFNRMAERLTHAMAAERHLASATERARIARELHDSISQDLFSLRLLAGGLLRALPQGSELRPQVEAMERTATGTMHEMQALLLELRPVALQDAGLVATLEELCQAYRDRLGVAVDADLEPVALSPAGEHAVLRIVQEALANAVKHARPTRITVLLRRVDGLVTVEVTDNGDGFDPQRAGERHGMGLGLMRERVAELGGAFQVDSVPGEGTSVRVVLGNRP